MGIFYSGQEILEMAIIIEEKGFEFYNTYAEDAKNEKIKKLFEYLGGEEINHKKMFQGFLDGIEKGEFSISYANEEVEQYFKAVVDSRVFDDPNFAIQLAKDTEDEIKAIDLAIGFEKDTILFYYELVGLVKEKTKDIIMDIIKEEKKHVQNLSKIKSELQ